MIEILVFLFAGAYGIREIIPIPNDKNSRYSKYILSIEQIVVGIIAIAWALLTIINIVVLWLGDNTGFFSKPDMLGTIFINVLLLTVGCILCYTTIDKHLASTEYSKLSKSLFHDKLIKINIPLGFALLAIGIWKIIF